ncbi:MAG: tRNA pseudouridine synthase B [Synergistetes bacterium ADurb.BinA166]|nr:MAG: tRNA pseudouridine synthase B [Synergistetes bacterium ADurb.BinA166]
MTRIPEGRGAVYLLDKSPGVTSRKAAAAAASAWGFRKFGHAGTLDPSAAGVLPVLLGNATRLSSYLTGHEKRYSFDVVTGVETDTLDAEGKVVRKSAPVTPSTAELAALLAELEGHQMQKVPVFSALKLGGRTACSIARGGGAPEMPVRSIETRDWEILGISEGRFRLAVTVSPGAYIRALAASIGERLGCGAHADRIVREASGPFDRSECSTEFDCERALISPAAAMRGYPAVTLDPEEVERVVHGNPVNGVVIGTVALLDGDGELIAIGESDGRSTRPVAVLARAAKDARA